MEFIKNKRVPKTAIIRLKKSAKTITYYSYIYIMCFNSKIQCYFEDIAAHSQEKVVVVIGQKPA